MSVSSPRADKKNLTVFDVLIIVFVFAISIGLFILSITGSGAVAKVEIIAENQKFLYFLQEDKVLVFQGPVGETHVTISNQQVQVTDSPGRQKICVNAGAISQNGQWLACLPNKVFLRIIGNNNSKQDNINPGIDGLSF